LAGSIVITDIRIDQPGHRLSCTAEGPPFAEARECLVHRGVGLGDPWRVVIYAPLPKTPMLGAPVNLSSESSDPAVRQFCDTLIDELQQLGVLDP
jgi:hypothetical protein